MRTAGPTLLPIFRSQLQGELLAAVLLSDEERSVSELAKLLGAPVQTVQREVARLEGAGILTSRRIGNTRLVRADRSSPVEAPLTELVLRTFGPVRVIGAEFAGVAGVRRVEIFGSWAARYQGEPGPPPGDIDVLVVGEPDRDEVFEAAQRAEQALGREVNTVIMAADRWESGTDPFLREILGKPHVPVIGGP